MAVRELLIPQTGLGFPPALQRAQTFFYRAGQLSFVIPQSLKAIKVTDVVQVDFGSDFDPEPYRFKSW